jgi:DNA-binding CsgD family transcriptional regulator
MSESHVSQTLEFSNTRMAEAVPGRRSDSLEFDDLLMSVYAGVHEVPPWHTFLRSLQEHAAISTGTLVLRQPCHNDGGIMVSVGTNEDCESRYRTSDYKDDPFLGIPAGQLFTLDEVISEFDLQQTAYYRELLSDARVMIDQMLAIDLEVPAFGIAKLRLSRRRGLPRFSMAERSLFVRLIPHLKVAVGHYARNTVLKIESKVYSRALNQLLMGTVILDYKDDIICSNEAADAILAQSPVIGVQGQQLQIIDGDRRNRWEEILGNTRTVFKDEGKEDIGAMRIPYTHEGKKHVLQLLVRPFRLPSYDHKTTDVGLAVFVSDGAMRHRLSRDVIAQLFGLTRAESMLVLKLCEGLAVGEAAYALNISTNTARSQLRSVYEKTGAHRLSELTGLIFHSTANLG